MVTQTQIWAFSEEGNFYSLCILSNENLKGFLSGWCRSLHDSLKLIPETHSICGGWAKDRTSGWTWTRWSKDLWFPLMENSIRLKPPPRPQIWGSARSPWPGLTPVGAGPMPSQVHHGWRRLQSLIGLIQMLHILNPGVSNIRPGDQNQLISNYNI